MDHSMDHDGKNKNSPDSLAGNLSHDNMKKILMDFKAREDDLTLKNQELLLSKSEVSRLHNRYFSLFENSPVPFLILNLCGQITEINQAAVSLFEEIKENILMKCISEFIEKKYEKKISECLASTMDSRTRTFKLEVSIFARKRKWLQLEGVFVENEYQISLLDITERVKKEQELRFSLNSTKSANQAKSQSLAVMSHEIRTPLSGILGMADLLMDTNLDNNQSEFVRLMQSSGNILLQLINDILDISKIEADKLELASMPLSIEKIASGLVGFFSYQARKKNTFMSYKIDERIPEYLEGDSGRLQQVLNNLLNNALKFTTDGYVELQVDVESDDNESMLLKFSVHDDGIGIDENKISLIFEPYIQSEGGATTQKYGGTGLGLGISKKLVFLMGGEIGAKSEKARGSTFWFTARFKKITAEKKDDSFTNDLEDEIIKRRLSGGKILIAEDDDLIQLVVRSILEKYNFDVKIVNNGIEAINELKVSDYNLVLMDCQMPEMTGFEATRIIRNPLSGVRNSQIPVIALTANAMKGDRQICLDSGMSDYLTKPISPVILIRTIQNYMESNSRKKS